jgi:hypothetical protein
MNYVVKVGSGAMIYMPSFIKGGPGIQNLTGGDLQTAWRLQNKESRLKTVHATKWRSHLYYFKIL